MGPMEVLWDGDGHCLPHPSDVGGSDVKLTCFGAVAFSNIDGNNIELEDFVGDDGMVIRSIRTQGHRESIHRT